MVGNSNNCFYEFIRINMISNNQELIEYIRGMKVSQLADLVKQIEETFGVSAAMTLGGNAGAAAGAAEPVQAEEKSEYKVTLQSAGTAEKVALIKALRKAVPALSLMDAKKLVEEAPAVVVEAAPKDDAKKIKAELEAAGAKVELA